MTKLVVLLIAGLLAGCANSSPTEDEGATAEEPSQPGEQEAPPMEGVQIGEGANNDTRWETHRTQFVLTSAAKALTLASSGDAHVQATLGGNVTAMLAELSWDSDVYDLDLAINFQVGCRQCPQEIVDHWVGEGDDGNYWENGGHIGAPDGPVSRLISSQALASYGCDASCNVNVYAWSKVAGYEVPGLLAVTFFDGPVPDSFSAL